MGKLSRYKFFKKIESIDGRICVIIEYSNLTTVIIVREYYYWEESTRWAVGKDALVD